MVTTHRPPGPDLWAAPWVTQEVLDSYRGMGAKRSSQLAPGPVGDQPAPIQRRNASAAERAIRDATGTTVDVSARPERSDAFFSSPFDADDYEAPAYGEPDPITANARRELAAIRMSEADKAAAERKARRNARDRARRERRYKARARRGETHHGPVPRGA